MSTLLPSLPLWNEPVPHSLGSQPNDLATLTPFLPTGASQPTPAIVICPGGGYGGLAMEHEGYHIARWFQERGIAGIVLKYRLPVHGYRHPVPLLDVGRALRLTRHNAAQWNLDPTHVGLMGFSAGGHLASTLLTHFDKGHDQAPDPVDRLHSRPDFGALIYPVVSFQPDITHQGSKDNLLGPNPPAELVENLSNEKQAGPQTPPTIFVHAQDDGPVPIANSRLMHAALREGEVLTELIEYPAGGHGFGYWPEKPNPRTDGWLEKIHAWFKANGFVS